MTEPAPAPAPRSTAGPGSTAGPAATAGPGPGRAARSPRRPTLAFRATLATTAVAFVAVLLTGAVGFGLIPKAAEQQARQTLAAQANLVAATIDRQDSLGAQRRLARLRQLLASQRIRLAVLRADGTAPGAVADPADAATVAGGRQVSAVRVLAGRRFLVEGRPLADGPGVLLLQPARTVRAGTADARRRLLLAMLVGLLGAAVAGLLLARRLARPLQHAAAAARRLSTGARDVRVEPAGPAEVAAVAEAINQLSLDLAGSEARQREFLLSVSHELRTPLTAVLGYAEAMADGLIDPAEVAATGETIRAEARRLDRLVSDLLDLARLGARDFRVEPGEVDLVDLLTRAATVWRDRAAAAGVALRLEVPADPLPASTDATRLRQIIDGLAENALRVTPAGAPIVLALRRDGAAALVEVRDGGPGLTEDDQAVAFERSALYDRYRGVRRVGTGVGLALVAGLAARLGGTATAGTAPEGGACFTVRLPLVPAGDRS